MLNSTLAPRLYRLKYLVSPEDEYRNQLSFVTVFVAEWILRAQFKKLRHSTDNRNRLYNINRAQFKALSEQEAELCTQIVTDILIYTQPEEITLEKIIFLFINLTSLEDEAIYEIEEIGKPTHLTKPFKDFPKKYELYAVTSLLYFSLECLIFSNHKQTFYPVTGDEQIRHLNSSLKFYNELIESNRDLFNTLLGNQAEAIYAKFLKAIEVNKEKYNDLKKNFSLPE